MNILSIDSTTKILSMATGSEETLIQELTGRDSSGHMVGITEMLDRLLKKSGLSLQDIDIYGVNKGPGDFTGTRIGISLIKMLSWIQQKPAYGINSLDVHAARIATNNIRLIAGALAENKKVAIMSCLDVKKDELYFSFYGFTDEVSGINDSAGFISRAAIKGRIYFLKITNAGERHLLGKDGFLDYVDNFFKEEGYGFFKESYGKNDLLLLIGGNFFTNYGEITESFLKYRNNIYLDKSSHYPGAVFVNQCAYYRAVQKVEPVNISPEYVREFIPFGKQADTSGRQV